MDNEISEQSESDNFSENGLFDDESAVYIQLPSADVESENEDVNWNQKTMPKRKCTHRKTIRYVHQTTKKTKRRAVPKKSIAKPSNKRSKKVSSNQNNCSSTKKIPINDNKTANVTKTRVKKGVPVVPKSTNSRAKKSIRDIKVNIKKNCWISGDFEKTTKFPKLTKNFGKYSSLSPTELFELFFSDDIWDHIQAETTKYGNYEIRPTISCFY